jgi:hypothetical protein
MPKANTHSLQTALRAAGMGPTAMARVYQTFNAATEEFHAAARSDDDTPR